MKSDKIFLFGAGIIGREALEYFGKEKVIFFIDNDINKVGSYIEGVEIISFEQMLAQYNGEKVILSVEIKATNIIAKQLEENRICNFKSFYEIKNEIKKSEILYAIGRYEELEERLQWFIEHADIKTLKPAKGYLRYKQLELIEFANDFFYEISDLNLKPFLICGNLIGAYRHKGYVPWDDDLDFGLIREEYDKLIDFCKKKYIVEIYDGKWSEYNSDKHIKRLDKIVKAHPNEYILDIWVDQIQITKGTSSIDRLSIDFWSFDYYQDDYKIEDHIKYLKEIQIKKKEIDYVNKIIEFLKKEIANNENISKFKTNLVFPGIDNVEAFLRMERTRDWLYTSDLFPLKKVQFENTYYYVPNNVERWLEYEYPNYMSYPSDVGINPHEGYKERCIIKNMPYVEFYLIDAFEIYHFLPLYHYFEKNGIYSYFVAEKPKKEKSWFDYETALKILEENGVRYKKECNYNADFVFTTQDEYLVDKYKNKKVHMCYGVGLTSYSFSESDRAINNFDLKLVHGECSYNIVKEKSQDLNIIKVGYLRYTKWGKGKYIYGIEEKKKQIEKNNSENKPILLYFPTWDSASSIEEYAGKIKILREKYFIVTKAHHCTYRLNSEARHREILDEISDMVLEGNFSFESAVSLSDLVVCDAVSGAATEVPFLNQDIKLILLYSPIKEKNAFKGFIDDYAFSVKSQDDLVDAVEKISIKDEYIEKRKQLINFMYDNFPEEGLQKLKNYIIENSLKEKKDSAN